jgi:acetyltransferase-like isoleucine patch superfamily enzyme
MNLKNLYIKFKSYYILYFKGGSSYAKYIGANIGENCRVYTKNFGSEPFLITIGNNVTITSGVKFITHDGSTWLMRDFKGRRFLYQKIFLKNNIFIGVNSIILPGVVIEDNVIVAAGSVVTKSIPSGVIVAGVPAKIIGDYSDYKIKILNNYVSEADLDLTINYEQRILKVLDNSHKEYLKK